MKYTLCLLLVKGSVSQILKLHDIVCTVHKFPFILGQTGGTWICMLWPHAVRANTAIGSSELCWISLLVCVMNTCSYTYGTTVDLCPTTSASFHMLRELSGQCCIDSSTATWLSFASRFIMLPLHSLKNQCQCRVYHGQSLNFVTCIYWPTLQRSMRLCMPLGRVEMLSTNVILSGDCFPPVHPPNTWKMEQHYQTVMDVNICLCVFCAWTYRHIIDFWLWTYRWTCHYTHAHV